MQSRELPVALLVLRIGLGVFLLLWSIDKMVAPEQTVKVFEFFYKTSLPASFACLYPLFIRTLGWPDREIWIRPSSSLGPRVSVVQASQSGQADYLGSLRRLLLKGASFGSVPDRGVDALRVVIRDVFAEQPAQMLIAHHDYVIE